MREINYDELILEGEVESGGGESECNENIFKFYVTVSS